MSGIQSLPGDRFEHGTRSRYVKGFRCRPCRESNRLYYHQRQAVLKERAAELAARDLEVEKLLGAEEQLAPRVWTTPGGESAVRFYSRACPGVDGPCPTRSHLRKDSVGGICGGCRVRLGSNALVSAEAARRHLLELSRRGVGRRSVAAAADVGVTLLLEVRKGRKKRIRRDTERRILAVDAGAVADAGLVPARPSWERIRTLRRWGWTKTAIAVALGSKSKTPALQLKGRTILARSALAVEQLYERAKRERAMKRRCPRCGISHRDDPHRGRLVSRPSGRAARGH